MQYLWGQIHQHFTCSFYVCRSQRRKKDSQLKKLYALLGSTSIKVKFTPGWTRTTFDRPIVSFYCVIFYLLADLLTKLHCNQRNKMILSERKPKNASIFFQSILIYYLFKFFCFNLNTTALFGNLFLLWNTTQFSLKWNEIVQGHSLKYKIYLH